MRTGQIAVFLSSLFLLLLAIIAVQAPRPAHAIPGTLILQGSEASFSGAITTAANQPVRPAFGPVTLQYKSGENSWSDGLIMREGDGNVGIGTGPGPSKLTVNGTIESTSGGFKFPDSTTQTAAASVPAGAVIFWDNGTTCPSGWSALAAARGRALVGLVSGGTSGQTVGTAFTLDTEDHTHTHTGPSHSHTYTDVVSHTHSIDPPATTSTSGSAAHTHSADPPATTTTSNGAHTHVKAVNQAGNGGVKFYQAAVAAGTISTAAGGSHTHTLDIAPFNADPDAHTHSTDVASFTSGSTGVASGTSAASGTGNTDTAATSNVLPYIQFLVCQKD